MDFEWNLKVQNSEYSQVETVTQVFSRVSNSHLFESLKTLVRIPIFNLFLDLLIKKMVLRRCGLTCTLKRDISDLSCPISIWFYCHMEIPDTLKLSFPCDTNWLTSKNRTSNPMFAFQYLSVSFRVEHSSLLRICLSHKKGPCGQISTEQLFFAFS